MSDTDDTDADVSAGDADAGTDEKADGGDAGGFDKEAEREKLREKYEQDRQRRESTEQMSELLLRGATMTNAHCDDCGSPIFRMDGEQFCPNCAGAQGEAASDGDDGAQSEAGDSGAEAEAANRSTGAVDRSAGAADRSAGAGAGAGAAAGAASGGGPADEGDDRTPTEQRIAERASTQREAEAASATPTASEDESGGSTRRRSPEPHDASVEEAPSLAQAKASLRRAIVSLSEQAAQSDDPARAKDLLEASGEAARALSELQE